MPRRDACRVLILFACVIFDGLSGRINEKPDGGEQPGQPVPAGSRLRCYRSYAEAGRLQGVNFIYVRYFLRPVWAYQREARRRRAASAASASRLRVAVVGSGMLLNIDTVLFSKVM